MEDRTNQSVFHTIGQFAIVWFCLFSLPLGGFEVMRFLIGTPGLFLEFFFIAAGVKCRAAR